MSASTSSGLESRRPLQHRAGPRPAPPRLPRGDDPQDPVPRGPGPGQARAHRCGLSQVLRRRRRAAALHPADAARPLPAAQGDRRPPRRDRPRPRAAGDRVRGADRAEGGAVRRRAAQPGVVPPLERPAALAARAAQGRRHLRGAARPARAVRAGQPRAPAPATSTATPWWSRRPPASWPTSASSRVTCAPSRPPRTARSGWCSRSWRPLARGRDAAARGRAEDAVSEIAALSVRLHATLVKVGLDADAALTRTAAPAARWTAQVRARE